MSDTVKSFIPCSPDYAPTVEQADGIKKGLPVGAELETTDEMQFCDAGQNFESVRCPFCYANLMEWWGHAMDAAYSDGHGFTVLNTITPCCGRAVSLNDLTYHFPQGFCKTKITIDIDSDKTDEAGILKTLYGVTGLPWRMIVARY